jgi:hypothetical protein
VLGAWCVLSAWCLVRCSVLGAVLSATCGAERSVLGAIPGAQHWASEGPIASTVTTMSETAVRVCEQRLECVRGPGAGSGDRDRATWRGPTGDLPVGSEVR